MQKILTTKPSSQWVQFLIHLGISIVLGILWYLLLYGRFPLYLSHVNWIYNAGGDFLQHQLGWEWFRQEPWRFPLGSIRAYGFPYGTSVTFTDAIPLFAFPFKLLSPWLEADFQYFGIWELFSIIGQILIGLLIMHEFTRSYPVKILGASMLVLSTPMIFRAFYHSSLSAHWIILAAIWFIILEYRSRLWRGAWLVLIAVAMLVHLYYVPMVLLLGLVGLFFHYRSDQKRWKIVLDVVAAVGVIVVMGYCLGIYRPGYSNLSISGFGTFTWNLNGFYNPFYFGSAYIKELPVTGGQYEGFSYLGLGNLLLLPVALYLFVHNETSRHKWTFYIPLGVLSVFLILFALSNRAYLDHTLLWEIPLSEGALRFLSLFRSSGRFIWPVFYFLVLFGLICAVRNVRSPLPVLVFVLVLQFFDIRPLYDSKRLDGFSVYESNLQQAFWQEAADNNEHIVIIPARYNKLFPYESLALYAVDNNLTLNYGYFARSDSGKNAVYANGIGEGLMLGEVDAETLYIFSDRIWEERAGEELADSMPVCEVDGYTVAFSTQNRMMSTGFDFASFCSVPEP